MERTKSAIRAIGLILGLTGFVLAWRFSAGEFAGSAEGEARRVKLHRLGRALGLVGLLMLAWASYL